MAAHEDPSSGDILPRLVAAHADFLSFLERRVGSREAAEDLLQEAFVRGLERGDSIRDGESAVAWFYRVLRNAVVDRARRRAAASRGLDRWEAELQAAGGGMDEALQGQVCRCVLQLIETLKPEYTAVLRAVDLGDESVGGFARAANITANNAAVRLHRARTALKQRLQAACGTCAEHGCLECHCGGPVRASV